MTDATQKSNLELDALAQCLAVHGPDTSRWPLQSQHRFAALVAGNVTAQKMLREAAALERLVRDAPAPNPKRLQQLRDRVMQAAAQTPRAQIAAPVTLVPVPVVPVPVVPVPASWPGLATASPSPDQSVNSRMGRNQPVMPLRIFGLPASLALAASLLLGIVVGGAGLPETPWGSEVPAAMASEGDADDAELAFGTESSDLDAEDFL